MAWFRVDDDFLTHPKVMRIPRKVRQRVLALWFSGGVYCAKHMTDGHLPGEMLDEWGHTSKEADVLVAAGLWVRKLDGGYVYHDFLDYNLSRAEQTEKRAAISAARSEAGKRGAEKRWGKKTADETPIEVPNTIPTEWQTDSFAIGKPVASDSPLPSPPLPTPPVTTEETAAQAQPAPAAKTRGTRIPESFAVTGDMMGWAREHLRGTGWRESDVIASTAKFRDYWTAKAGRDGVKLDWVATWRNWIRRDAENGPRPAAAGPALRQSHATRLVASVTAPGGLMDRAIQRDIAAGRIADPNAPTQPTLEIGPA